MNFNLSINSLLTNLIIFILSFSFGLILITYFLQLPHLLTGQPGIVNQYYRSNFVTNVPLELFFVLVYFLIGLLIIKLLKIKKRINKVLVIGITTAVITAGFCFYFRSYPQTKNFFSKWFHTVGYSSVLYDVILLVFIYLVHLKILNYIQS